MNPDGYTEELYENANFVNLNRDFPDPIQRKGKALTASGKEQVRGWGGLGLFLATCSCAPCLCFPLAHNSAAVS